VVLWVVAILGLLIASAALAHARRLARRLDVLNQSYWELRYDYTRLRSQVARLDPDQAADPAQDSGQTAPEAAPSVSFVPLSSIRRKEH
jgi:hypothetical protein